MIQILFWVISGLFTIVTFLGGAYLRKLSADISRVENSHAAILTSIQLNCQAEVQRYAARGERLAALEMAQVLLKDDLKYIRERVDEIATSLGAVAKRGE